MTAAPGSRMADQDIEEVADAAVAGETHRCGTCGTANMIITCRAGTWSMGCGNGHPFIYAGEDIEVRVDVEPLGEELTPELRALQAVLRGDLTMRTGNPEVIRDQVTTAIEDVFVRTLRVDLDQDVPMLTGLLMEIICAEIDAAYMRGRGSRNE